MISAIVQARMGSQRLTGKSMMEINSKPIVWHVINHLKACRNLDKIILAIPNTLENNILEDFAKANNISCFRGPESDVLLRYYRAAKEFDVDTVVRITADCPLINPQVVDLVINKFKKSNVDYASNVIRRTYPKGFDTEVFGFDILEKVHQLAVKPEHREHVTLYILDNQEQFKLLSVEQENDESNLNYCVDYRKDLDYLKTIWQKQ